MGSATYTDIIFTSRNRRGPINTISRCPKDTIPFNVDSIRIVAVWGIDACWSSKIRITSVRVAKATASCIITGFHPVIIGSFGDNIEITITCVRYIVSNARGAGRGVRSVSPYLVICGARHAWPGNVNTIIIGAIGSVYIRRRCWNISHLNSKPFYRPSLLVGVCYSATNWNIIYIVANAPIITYLHCSSGTYP